MNISTLLKCTLFMGIISGQALGGNDNLSNHVAKLDESTLAMYVGHVKDAVVYPIKKGANIVGYVITSGQAGFNAVKEGAAPYVQAYSVASYADMVKDFLKPYFGEYFETALIVVGVCAATGAVIYYYNAPANSDMPSKDMQ